MFMDAWQIEGIEVAPLADSNYVRHTPGYENGEVDRIKSHSLREDKRSFLESVTSIVTH